MKKSKKVIALLLAVAMVSTMALTGCKSKENNAASTTEPTATQAAADDTAATATPTVEAKYDGDTGFDIGDVETYDILWESNFQGFDNWESPVAQKITEMTGVKLNFIMATGDYNEQVALMLAGGDYPDLMLAQSDTLATLVNAGVTVDLSAMIDKYGPNIKKFYGDYYKRLSYSVDNPAIYGFGVGTQYTDQAEGIYWNSAFWLQLGVIKELGYPQIKTLDQFEDALVKYKTAHPKYDGQDTIGLTLVTSDGWRYLISLTNPSYYSAGKPDNGEWYVDDTKGEVRYHYREESDKDYFKWLNKLYNEGILDPESFTQTYDEYIAKISSGRVLGLIDGYWEFSSACDALTAAGKNDRTYMPFAVTQKEGEVYPANWSDGGISSGGIIVTNKCKNPEKIVNFFNYLASDDGQVLREWGIKDVNYTVSADGTRVRNPEDVKRDLADPYKYLSETGVKVYRSLYWCLQGRGYTLADGQPLNSEDSSSTIAAFTAEQKEALAAYGYNDFTDAIPKPELFPKRIYGSMSSYSPSTEELQTILTNAGDYRLPDITNAVLGSEADFDANWATFMKHLDDTGLSKVEAEATQVYQNRLKAWGN